MYETCVAPILANIWNEEILLSKHFLEILKLVDATLIFLKKDKTLLKITDQQAFYQQIFERIMQK